MLNNNENSASQRKKNEGKFIYLPVIRMWNRKIEVSIACMIAFILLFSVSCNNTSPNVIRKNKESILKSKKSNEIPNAWIHRDKIRMAWTGAEPTQFNEMRAAGMNAIMPRVELDAVMDYKPKDAKKPLSKLDSVAMKRLRLGSSQAKRFGLRYFHCLDLAAESQTVQVGFKNNPARFNDGSLPSPVDPVYWRRAILQRVQRMLDLLDDTNEYALDGVIIDPEMYTLSAAIPGNADYGTFAFQTFLKDINHKTPARIKNVTERKIWLRKNNLQKRFVDWQFNRISSMAGKLRKLVHARRPEAVLGFIIYKNKLWFNALAKGLSGIGSPVFIGPESTYNGIMDESFIKYMRRIRETVGVPCFLVPGISMGMNKGKINHRRLDVLAGNIYHRCRYTDGYWIWASYRFGKTEKQRTVFYRILSQVNAGLDYTKETGKVYPRLKARHIPMAIPKKFSSILKSAKLLEPVSANPTRSMNSFKVPQLRGVSVLAMWPRKENESTLTINVKKLGNYLDSGTIKFFDSKGRLLWVDSIALGASRIFRIPETPGKICVAIISAGQNAYRIENFTCPVLLLGGTRGVSLNAVGDGGRFFFFVPENKKRFTIRMSGHPIEMADYTLYDPTGKVVKSWKKLRKARTSLVKVENPGVWRIDVDHMIDDAGFALLDLPNVFALRPEDVRKYK